MFCRLLKMNRVVYTAANLDTVPLPRTGSASVNEIGLPDTPSV